MRQPGRLLIAILLGCANIVGCRTTGDSGRFSLTEVEKGDGSLLPERPEGCFAQKAPVPFFNFVARGAEPDLPQNDPSQLQLFPVRDHPVQDSNQFAPLPAGWVASRNAQETLATPPEAPPRQPMEPAHSDSLPQSLPGHVPAASSQLQLFPAADGEPAHLNTRSRAGSDMATSTGGILLELSTGATGTHRSTWDNIVLPATTEETQSVHVGLMEHMVILGGADYFKSGGDLKTAKLFAATNQFGLRIRGRIANLDPDRAGGFVAINTAAPLTTDGPVGLQFGLLYNQVEMGGQGFFTAGLFHRSDPHDWYGLNFGVAYDFLYDDLHTYHVGQVRFQIGKTFGPRNELGTWFNLVTQVDQTGVPIITESAPNASFLDSIAVDFKPVKQGHVFWRHNFSNGATTMLFLGARGSPTGALVFGGTAQWPVDDHWAFSAGGHLSDDNETFNIYSGIALFPGGGSCAVGSCGRRYMPYMDVANNTFLSVYADPVAFEALGLGLVPL